MAPFALGTRPLTYKPGVALRGEQSVNSRIRQRYCHSMPGAFTVGPRGPESAHGKDPGNRLCRVYWLSHRPTLVGAGVLGGRSRQLERILRRESEEGSPGTTRRV